MSATAFIELALRNLVLEMLPPFRGICGLA